eukprot:1179832-Prorocentrum_minimum.AAC.2
MHSATACVSASGSGFLSFTCFSLLLLWIKQKQRSKGRVSHLLLSLVALDRTKAAIQGPNQPPASLSCCTGSNISSDPRAESATRVSLLLHWIAGSNKSSDPRAEPGVRSPLIGCHLELEVVHELVVDAVGQPPLVAEELEARHLFLVQLQRVVLELQHVQQRARHVAREHKLHDHHDARHDHLRAPPPDPNKRIQVVKIMFNRSSGVLSACLPGVLSASLPLLAQEDP